MNSSSDNSSLNQTSPSQATTSLPGEIARNPIQNQPPPAPPVTSSQPLPASSPVATVAPAISPSVSEFSSTTAPPVNPPTTPPPFVLNSSRTLSKSHKFPLTIVALFIIVAAAGFGGSFFYYGVLGKDNKKTTASLPPANPPPTVTVIPTDSPPTNIFVTPSISFRSLFSSNVFASDNPFDDTSNPFTGVTAAGAVDADTYQNPFEGLP